LEREEWARGVCWPSGSSCSGAPVDAWMSSDSEGGGVMSRVAASAFARESAAVSSRWSRSRGMGRLRSRIDACGMGASVDGVLAADLRTADCPKDVDRIVGFE